MFQLLRSAAAFLLLGCLFVDAGEGDDVFAKARKAISPQKDFHVALRSVTITRDEESGRTSCTVLLGASWDKRLSPLLLQQGAMSVTFAKDASGKSLTKDTSPQGPTSVVGRSDAGFKIQVSAPPRSSAQIDVLKGEVTLTTPSKMLSFTYGSLKLDRPVKATMEGVTVTLDKVTAGPDRLSVELIIENPKGTPSFETFQTSAWLENNTIFLRRKPKQYLVPDDNDGELLEPLTPLRARIRYHFKVERKTLGELEEWRLVYSTPGPIVEVPVPFELRNIPLP